MSQIIDKGTVNGIKYFKYQPDITGANPYYIAIRDGKLYYTNTISRNTVKKDFDKPVKYDRASKRILVGAFNFDPKEPKYQKELKRLDKALVYESQFEYVTQVVNNKPISIGKEPDKPKTSKSNSIDNITEDNLVYPVYSYGKGTGSDNPMLVYKENGKTYLRRLKKDWKNFKGENRFYVYDDGKKRTYEANIDKNGVASNLSIKIDDHDPLGNKNNINRPSAYRNIEYQFGGGETNLRFEPKSKNPKIIDFGLRKIATQDHTTYKGTDGITFKDDKGDTINYVAGMTPEERKLADLPKIDSEDNTEVRFPKSRSYEYVVLNTGGEPGNYQFIVRKGDKLYLTNSLPRNANNISTRRPVVYNKNTNKFDVYDYSGAPSTRISKDKLQLLSGMGKNSITGKDMSRNSINNGLENFANIKIQAPKQPTTMPIDKIEDLDKKKDEPITPPVQEPEPETPPATPPAQEPEAVTPPATPPATEPKAVTPPATEQRKLQEQPDIGDATGNIAQQAEEVELITPDEVNLNVVKKIDQYKIPKKEIKEINLTKPDGTNFNTENFDRLKNSYNIDRYLPEIQKLTFQNYYEKIKKEHPRKLQYYIDEPDILLNSFYQFVSELEDTMDARYEDLYQVYGNDEFKNASRGVPVIRNPNIIDQDDVDYNFDDIFLGDDFNGIMLSGLLFSLLKNEPIVLKNEDQEPIVENYLNHTEDALKSRVANKIFRPEKMDITQLKFLVIMTMAGIFSLRKRKPSEKRLRNIVARTINNLPYTMANLETVKVDNVFDKIQTFYRDHPYPFNYGLLSEFYEPVITYLYEEKPEAQFKYFFAHVNDLNKLIPSIEEKFNNRQSLKQFILNLYEKKENTEKTFKKFNKYIRGMRRLNINDFQRNFEDGTNIFDEVPKGREYEITNERTNEVIEKVFIPYDESKKAITLYINAEGRYYESRENDRQEGQEPTQEDIEKFPLGIIDEKKLKPTFVESLIDTFGKPIYNYLSGAVGVQVGKLFLPTPLLDDLSKEALQEQMDTFNLNADDPPDLARYNSYIAGGHSLIYNLISKQAGPEYDLDPLLDDPERLPQLALIDDVGRSNPDRDILLSNFYKFFLYGKANEAKNFISNFYTKVPNFKDISEMTTIETREPLAEGLIPKYSIEGRQFDGEIVIDIVDDGYIDVKPLTFPIFKKLKQITKAFNIQSMVGLSKRLDDQPWVGINPIFIPRDVAFLALGYIILNPIVDYFTKTTTEDRIRDKNRRGELDVIDLTVGKTLPFKNKSELDIAKQIIEDAENVYFLKSELKPINFKGTFIGRNIPLVDIKVGFRVPKILDDIFRSGRPQGWQNEYMERIVEPHFEKYAKYMTVKEKYNEIARFVISAQAYHQNFDQRVYQPNTYEPNINDLKNILSDKADSIIDIPNVYKISNPKALDFWQIFEAVPYRFRKVLHDHYNFTYEDMEDARELLNRKDFIATLDKNEFILDELPQYEQETIDNQHETDLNLGEEAKPSIADYRYIKLSRLANKIGAIRYQNLLKDIDTDITLLQKTNKFFETQTSQSLRGKNKLKKIENDFDNMNIAEDFKINSPEYFTDLERDFILIKNPENTRLVIGLGSSRFNKNISDLTRDWTTNLLGTFQNRATKIIGFIKEFLNDRQEIYISGHSLGSAVGNLIALNIGREYMNQIHFIGFATPGCILKDKVTLYTETLKKGLYKNYYIHNDAFGRLGAYMVVPEKNNFVLYKTGWKEVNTESSFLNNYQNFQATFNDGTHNLNLYQKYLRIAVKRGEIKGETPHSRRDVLLNFSKDEFLKKNPDVDIASLNYVLKDENALRERIRVLRKMKIGKSREELLNIAIKEEINKLKKTMEEQTDSDLLGRQKKLFPEDTKEDMKKKKKLSKEYKKKLKEQEKKQQKENKKSKTTFTEFSGGIPRTDDAQYWINQAKNLQDNPIFKALFEGVGEGAEALAETGGEGL
jgi:hypothetical protein